MSQKKQLLVIGAGASGLPAIRHALFYNNIEITCFEKSNDIGGLWNYKPYESELGSVMKSTVINTSKELTSYSDFPPDDTMANYMHNTELLRYLRKYADNFDLLKYIKFNHSVESIKRNDDYETTGKWRVKYLDDHGIKQERIFDGVLMCFGHHAIPYVPPKWPGQDTFKGRVLHSHSYKDQRGYEDKVVVVVGIGNSGCDLAVELSRVAKQVYLVTRRGSWIFNRLHDRGEPTDLVFTTKFRMDIGGYIPQSVMSWYIQRILNQRFDHEKYGLKPKHTVLSAHQTMNDELPNRIACGMVKIKPGIQEFSEKGMVFDDGSKVDEVDEVLLATGYSYNFDIVENGNLIPVEENKIEAYKYVFPIATSDHNTLGIIGLVQSNIIPISEMQARVFLESFAGNIELPTREKMIENVNEKRDQMEKRFVASRRHTIQVDFTSYLHELGELIGCNPTISNLIFQNPSLAYKIYFGPCVPYVFRMNGPNSWEGAAQAILDVDYRSERPTNPKIDRKTEESKKTK